MIDRITTWEVGHCAEALKNVTLSEDFFDDHFPRRPIMPGVLMIEGMAQLAGLLLEESLREKYGDNAKALMTVLERTKFREPIRPGDTLTYRVEITSLNQNGGKATAQASCDGRVVATTGIVFVFKQVNDPMLEAKRAELLSLWKEPDFHKVSYNTKILGTFYNFSHRVVYQKYELIVCPIAAMVLLAASLLVLSRKKGDPLPLAKVLFAAGIGPLGFSFLRMTIAACYSGNMVWFNVWEEGTELIFIIGVCVILWTFRGSLLQPIAIKDRDLLRSPDD